MSVELQPLARFDQAKAKRRIICRDLRASNKAALSSYLENVNIKVLVESNGSCEEKLETLENVIKVGLAVIMPLKARTVVLNEAPWVTTSLKSLIHRRQKALALGNMMDYRSLRNRINRDRKACRSKYYAAKVQHLKECKPSQWWKEVKRLSGFTPVSHPDPLTVLKHLVGEGGEQFKDSRCLANFINKAFLSQMSEFTPLSPLDPVHGYAHDQASAPPPVSDHSVFTKLHFLNPRKAPGPDGIPAWLLKENADILAAPVADILNASYQEGRLPYSWKRADIIPLNKQTPVSDVNKHLRPISLTPILSKVAEEYVVQDYIKPAVMQKIDPNQFGTVPNSSTTHALISMLDAWYRGTDGNGAIARAVLFDFKKAFDLIDHHILCEKLLYYDLPPWVIHWIKSFLTNRQQRVKLSQDCFSEWGPIPAGVPQGTKLGPWLFAIMINDIKVNGGAMLWKYVDDTTISEIIPRGQLGGIQAVVDDLSSQSQRERFKLNEAKCKELRISFAKNSQDNLDPIVVNNKNLEVIPTAKLLGLTISSNLKWNAHVSEIVSKAASRLFLLRQFKRACSEPNELLCFYRTCIRPVAEYACQAYHNSLPAYLSDDLERIQRRALRIIYPFCSYREALTLSGLTSLKSRRESLTTRLFKEILEDPNHNLHGLLPPMNETIRSLRQKRTFSIPRCKTKRYQSSFIIANALHCKL